MTLVALRNFLLALHAPSGRGFSTVLKACLWIFMASNWLVLSIFGILEAISGWSNIGDIASLVSDCWFSIRGLCIQIFRKNEKYALCILSNYNVNILLFSSLGTWCVPVQGCGTILVDNLAGQQTMTRLKCSGFSLYYWVVCMICCSEEAWCSTVSFHRGRSCKQFHLHLWAHYLICLLRFTMLDSALTLTLRRTWSSKTRRNWKLCRMNRTTGGQKCFLRQPLDLLHRFQKPTCNRREPSLIHFL